MELEKKIVVVAILDELNESRIDLSSNAGRLNVDDNVFASAVWARIEKRLELKSPVSPRDPLITKLLDADIIPQLCTSFTLNLSVGWAPQIKAEALVSQEQFQKIVDALVESPEAARKIARTIIFHSPFGQTAEVDL